MGSPVAKIADAPAKRVGDYNPDIETGELLDKIEGQDVTIAGVTFDNRSGKKGPYTLAIITLDTGAVYHTGGAVVVERLRKVADENGFPLVGKFEQVRSASNPGQEYWTVS
jgi:hypothetical protein